MLRAAEDRQPRPLRRPEQPLADVPLAAEPALLDEVLRRLDGNRWAAAGWLGLNRATVRKKLAHYGLHQAQTTAEDEETAEE